LCSDNKAAQDSLKQKKEEVKNVIQNAPIAIYEIDFDGSKIRTANSAVSQWLGYSEEEIFSITPLSLFGEESKKKFQELVIEALAGNKTLCSAEFEVRAKNGQSVWGLFHAKINFKNGKPDTVLVFAQDITERKKAEEALRKGEEKYRQIVTSAQEGILILDQQGKITFLNQVLADWIGYTVEELLGEFVFKFIADEDLEKTYERWQKRRVDVVESYDLKLKRKDGADVWLIVNGTALKDREGNFGGLLAMVANITERKKIEVACKESEERFRFLVESTSDMIWQVDQNAVYTYVSPKVKDILGYEPQEVVGKTPFDLISEDDTEKMAKAFAEIANKMEPFYGLENWNVHKNGSLVLLETNGVPILDETGQLAGYRGIDRDITERKKADDAIRQSERKLQNIINAMDDGIVLLGLDGRIIDCNQATLNQYNLTREEVIGKIVTDFIVSTNRKNIIEETIAILQKTGKARVEAQIFRKDYSPFFAEISLTRFYNEHNSPIGLLGVARDITERKKVEETLGESEQLYRTLFDNSEDGFMLLEPIFDENKKVSDFRFLKLNSEYARQTGAKADDVLGKLASEVTPELEPEIALISCDVAKTGKPVHNEAYNKYSNRWYDSYFFPYAKNQVGILFRDTTERKKTEETLRESQKKYQNLTETANDLIWEMDAKGRYTYVSPQVEKLWGTKPSDMIEKSFFDAMPPVEKERVLDVLSKIGGSPEPFLGLQTSAYDSQGRLVYIETNGVPFFDKEGRLLGFRGISRDITERKKAEESLRMEKERFEGLTDSLPEIIFETDINGKIVYANKSGFEITGYTEEDLGKGFDVFSLIAPQDKEKAIEYFKNAPNNQSTPYYEFIAAKKDGSTFPVIISAKSIVEKGRPIGLRGIVIDITERKKAEETLKESEEKFYNMFEQSPAIFEIYDKKGIEIQVNRAWDRLWNIPRENIIGKYNILQSKQIAETGWLPLLKKVFFDGETVFVAEKEFDASLEPEGAGKGRKRWLKSLIYPIKNSHGEITNVVFMHEDITEKKMLEQQLLDKERLATIGATAGMVGHDIRNPLQTIVSELYIAKQAIAEAPKDKHTQDTLESLSLIEEEVGYISKIVADLQDFARPIVPELVEVEIKTLVTGVLSTLNVPDNVEADAYFDEDLPKLATDPTIMKRVLFNLANNALQAMPEGGKLTIHVSQDKTTSCIIIAVNDTGVGIAKEIQDKLFTPLFTTKSKGQGFGLAAVKRMVEALGGTVTFVSEEGKGTTFTVELPISNS
jgi:PAS domain S-box-containing protein